MGEAERKVRTIVRDVLAAKGANDGVMTAELSAPLYEADGGLGLDSLATAELSALLEQEFGTDPYSQGNFVTTLGELVRFYEKG